MEAGWLDPQNEARPNVAPPASGPRGVVSLPSSTPVDEAVG